MFSKVSQAHRMPSEDQVFLIQSETQYSFYNCLFQALKILSYFYSSLLLTPISSTHTAMTYLAFFRLIFAFFYYVEAERSS